MAWQGRSRRRTGDDLVDVVDDVVGVVIVVVVANRRGCWRGCVARFEGSDVIDAGFVDKWQSFLVGKRS